MFNPKHVTLIDCANFDSTNYRIYVYPDIDIAYFDNDKQCNPIYETAWIKIDAYDITDKYVCIPYDLSDKSIKDLIRIMNCMWHLIRKLNEFSPKSIFHLPKIIRDLIDRKDKFRVPFLKPMDISNKYDGSLEISFSGSFNVTSPDGETSNCHKIEFNILHINVRGEDNEDQLMDDIDDLDMMVII